jgi:hypothetical protein
VPHELGKSARAKLGDASDYAACRSEMKVGAIHGLMPAGECDATRIGARIGHSQGAQLRLDDSLQPGRGDRE